MKSIHNSLKNLSLTLLLILVFTAPRISLAQNQNQLNESLWLAFQDGDTSEMRNLVKQGAEINYEDPYGFNLLFWAQEYSADEYIIDFMIELGAIDRNEEVSGFMNACENGNLKKVKHLLNEGFDINDFRVWIDPIEEDPGCDCFETGISAAIRSGNIDLVRFMIEKGANLNFDQNGVQPLYIALEERNYEIADLLLENGADMDMRFALDNGYYSESATDAAHLDYLIDNDFPYEDNWDNALIQAAASGDAETMRKLFPLVTSDEIDIAMCFSSDVEISKILIEEGGSVNAYFEDNSGCGGCAYSTTPLNSAIIDQNLELVKYLIEVGVEIDYPSEVEEGEFWECWMISPLAEAASIGNIEAAKILIDLGANVNYVYINSYYEIVSSPLINAIQENNLEMVRLLLKNGAEIKNEEWDAADYINDDTSVEIVQLIDLV